MGIKSKAFWKTAKEPVIFGAGVIGAVAASGIMVWLLINFTTFFVTVSVTSLVIIFTVDFYNQYKKNLITLELEEQSVILDNETVEEDHY